MDELFPRSCENAGIRFLSHERVTVTSMSDTTTVVTPAEPAGTSPAAPLREVGALIRAPARAAA